MEQSGLRIAVDFDGTIVEHKYPAIGKEMLFAFETLKQLQKKGHTLILWTYRIGEDLEAAVEYCKENGVEFYAVNANHPEEQWTPEIPRKLDVDLFIDDRNVGGFLGWSEIWQRLHPESGPLDYQLKNPDAHKNFPNESNSGGFWKKLFS
ncbi:BT0820 family HAD-type phosphatase [Luteibaculum oceani]|uniref:Hydrolase n=1 Tax=Luteibaculum oceani TaxID=1294296 RepID=A0A5C6V352_9FLAO|nr:hydrolase [Luteibaculum oceani]TXC78966.1 hydrolase [Luteibaculum oceani]